MNDIEKIASKIDEEPAQKDTVQLLYDMMTTKDKKFWSNNFLSLVEQLKKFENPDELLGKYSASENPQIRNRTIKTILALREDA